MDEIQMPEILPYPTIQSLDKCPEINNRYCYVLKHYPISGKALLIIRSKPHVCVRLANFDGEIIDPEKQKEQCFEEIFGYLSRLIETMRCIKIPKAIFYFSVGNDVRLIDMRLSIDRYCSPGYLKDFFGRQKIPIQEDIGKPIVMNTDGIDLLKKAEGDYSGKAFILKPTVYRSIIRGDDILPMYASLIL